MYVTTLSMSEARATLPALLDRVEQGDEVTITRHGRPVAVLIAMDNLHVRRAAAAQAVAEANRLEDLLTTGRRGGPGLMRGRADELVHELRAERDAE